MNDKFENNKFDWNNVVIVKNDAPKYLHPGEIASICGMEKVEFENVAKRYHTEIGNWIYTIEFNDGSDITIPEMYLDKLDLDEVTNKY
jgi:hypothetical protein